ncbi:MAG: 4Fe-4S binding protein [Cellulosilyticaceae bacterium]
MKKKYKILEGCVACGACKIVCPTHCISKGKPYKINEERCIGCGLCVKRCWRRVIDKA